MRGLRLPVGNLTFWVLVWGLCSMLPQNRPRNEAPERMQIALNLRHFQKWLVLREVIGSRVDPRP